MRKKEWSTQKTLKGGPHPAWLASTRPVHGLRTSHTATPDHVLRDFSSPMCCLKVRLLFKKYVFFKTKVFSKRNFVWVPSNAHRKGFVDCLIISYIYNNVIFVSCSLSVKNNVIFEKKKFILYNRSNSWRYYWTVVSVMIHPYCYSSWSCIVFVYFFSSQVDGLKKKW